MTDRSGGTGVTGRFRKTVAVHDGDLERLLKFHGEFHGQGACAADEVAETGKLVRLHVQLCMEKKLQQSRHNADHRYFLRADPLKELAGMKPLVQDDRAPGVERGHQGYHDPVHMVEWKHTHQALVFSDLVPFGDGHGIDEEIVLIQQHPFRIPRGAGRVHDQRFALQ